MSEFEVTYTITPGYLRRFIWAATPAMAVLEVAVPVAFLSVSLVPGSHLFALAAVVFVALVVWRNRSMMRLTPPGTDVTMTFTTTSLHMSTDTQSGSRSWTGYTWVKQRRGFWVLRVTPFLRTAFPSAALDTEQTQAFLALLSANNIPVIAIRKPSHPPAVPR